MGAPEDARVALLSRLIDHAPLFPPASLPLEEAVAADRRARADAAAFILARFVCPASRLPDLPDVGRGVTVVLDHGLEPQGPVEDERVEAVETRMPEDPAALATLAGLGTEAYVEVPLDGDLERSLDALAGCGLRAKVRCGGASVPTTSELARLVRGCAERGLVFKATAGLHHALPSDGEHGLLNLLAAVVFGDEEAALVERDPTAFELGPDAFSWRGRFAGATELAHVRQERLAAVGSCSFFEPVGELAALGMLPA